MRPHNIFISTLDPFGTPGWFWFGFAFFSRAWSHFLSCIIPYLVSPWSVPAHVLRPSSDLAIPPLLYGRLHPFPSLYSPPPASWGLPLSLVPYCIGNFPLCVVIIYTVATPGSDQERPRPPAHFHLYMRAQLPIKSHLLSLTSPSA